MAQAIGIELGYGYFSPSVLSLQTILQCIVDPTIIVITIILLIAYPHVMNKTAKCMRRSRRNKIKEMKIERDE